MPSYNRQGAILTPSTTSDNDGFIPIDTTQSLETTNDLRSPDAILANDIGASLLEIAGRSVDDDDSNVTYIAAVNVNEFLTYLNLSVGTNSGRAEAWRAVALVPFTWAKGGQVFDSRIDPLVMRDDTGYILKITVSQALENGDDFVVTLDYSATGKTTPGVFRIREAGYDILALPNPANNADLPRIESNIGTNKGLINIQGRDLVLEIQTVVNGIKQAFVPVLNRLPGTESRKFWWEIIEASAVINGTGFTTNFNLDEVSTVNVNIETEYNEILLQPNAFVEIEIGKGAPTRYNIESIEIADRAKTMLLSLNATLGGA